MNVQDDYNILMLKSSIDTIKHPLFIMTVDVDGWSSILNFYSIVHDPFVTSLQVRVEEGIKKLLQLFKKHNINATFFITGNIAQNNDWIIKKIINNGHEIACHGLTHRKNEFLLPEMNQRNSIEKATQIIKEINGAAPKGFRAPCLRANETTIKILEEYGYMYDSSVLPSLIPGYYGSPGAPLKPYYPSPFSLNKRGSHKLLEIPVSINPLIPIPLSAAWMRNLGSSWVKFGVIMNFILGNPVVLYVHPRDVISLPVIKGMPWHVYRNVGTQTIRMLDNVIEYGKTLGAKFIKAVDLALVKNKYTNRD